jgi:aspartate oxidase
VVVGRRLGAALSAARGWTRVSPARPGIVPDATALQLEPQIWAALRRLMWTHAGIVRHAEGLLAGLAELATLYRRTPRQQILLRGRLSLAEALLTAAWLRKESCGAHLRGDDRAAPSRQAARHLPLTLPSGRPSRVG